MARKMVCAFTKESDTKEGKTLDVVVQADSTNDVASSCPLAKRLPDFTADFTLFFSALVELGILKNNHGHFEFTEMHSSCPFTQPQQPNTQPLEEQQP